MKGGFYILMPQAFDDHQGRNALHRADLVARIRCQRNGQVGAEVYMSAACQRSIFTVPLTSTEPFSTELIVTAGFSTKVAEKVVFALMETFSTFCAPFALLVFGVPELPVCSPLVQTAFTSVAT